MLRVAAIAVLVVLLAGLQWRLWFGDGGVTEVMRLERAAEAQRAENERLEARNAALEADVDDLKSGLEAVEERARRELGMVREGETFFQVTGASDEQ
ncbi:cell division protein FtsB [Arhodomonas sp. SL1]|uniref:cell division protein FtsB n=1 Tax=Arhodomonas sp. SL1 TaxID=3425691 RepID=UPI003F88454E